MAQNAIKDILNETQPVPVTIEKIVGEVSRTFNVSPADIRGTKRNANVASARRVAIYILREVTGMSMEEIGREFSGRDHSTIVYSLKTMERDMKNDQHLRETVSDIIKNVKADGKTGAKVILSQGIKPQIWGEMQGNPGKQNKILCSDDKVLHSFHRVFNIQLLFCTPAVERKAAPTLSTSLSHCIHKPVENHGAASFHTFSDFSTSSPAPTTNTTTSSI